MNTEKYLTTNEVKNIFHIHTQTIMRWRKSGKLKYKQISSRKFLYKQCDIEALLGESITNETPKINVAYCRVSTTKQKEDLQKQEQLINDYCNSNGIIINNIYTDIASGMNEDRIGFNKLLKDIIERKVDTVYITYKDRLTRFGFKYFETFFDLFDTKIVVLNNIEQENLEQELTEDLISIIHHFSMKMYSNRRKELKKIKKQIEDKV